MQGKEVIAEANFSHTNKQEIKIKGGDEDEPNAVH